MDYNISIVVPTIGRDEILVASLRSLENQKNVHFEIVVVDQNDDELPFLSGYLKRCNCSILHLRVNFKNASAARNLGALAASSDIILFIDDDVEIDSQDFLLSHMKNYMDSEMSGVAGQILEVERKPRCDRHRLSTSERSGWLYFPRNYNQRVLQFGIGGAGNFSVRKNAYLLVGGMDENFIKGAYREESDFIQRFWKAGFKGVFDPDASLVHLGEKTGGIRNWGRSVGVQQMQHVVGEWYFILKHIDRHSWAHFLLALLRRQIINRPNLRHPANLLTATARSIRGFVEARRLLRSGERTLKNPEVLNRHLAILAALKSK